MSKEEFLRLYDVKNIWNYTLDESKCHNGTAPTIQQCVKYYGRDAVRNIIRQHLDLFIDFIKAKDKPNDRQRDIIVWFCISQFGGLKITQYQLFIIKAMSGEFGKFYNTLDPLEITTSLRVWQGRCQGIRNAYLEEQARKREDEERESWILSPKQREESLRMLEEIGRRLFKDR